jgi:hypothetical protein
MRNGLRFQESADLAVPAEDIASLDSWPSRAENAQVAISGRHRSQKPELIQVSGTRCAFVRSVPVNKPNNARR